MSSNDCPHSLRTVRNRQRQNHHFSVRCQGVFEDNLFGAVPSALRPAASSWPAVRRLPPSSPALVVSARGQDDANRRPQRRGRVGMGSHKGDAGIVIQRAWRSNRVWKTHPRIGNPTY